MEEFLIYEGLLYAIPYELEFPDRCVMRTTFSLDEQRIRIVGVGRPLPSAVPPADERPLLYPGGDTGGPHYRVDAYCLNCHSKLRWAIPVGREVPQRHFAPPCPHCGVSGCCEGGALTT